MSIIQEFSDVLPSVPYILQGVIVTLKYTGISLTLGLLIGILLAAAKVSPYKRLASLAHGYTFIFRGTPLLLQLSFFYFALPGITGLEITAFTAGIFTFSLNSGAYTSEIIRAGIEAVGPGQWEAAHALAIPYKSTMKDIILPQALRKILPALLNEMVDLLKESALISVIGEADLLRRASIVAAEKFIYFAPLTVAALAYATCVFLLTQVANRLEKKLKS